MRFRVMPFKAVPEAAPRGLYHHDGLGNFVLVEDSPDWGTCVCLNCGGLKEKKLDDQKEVRKDEDQSEHGRQDPVGGSNLALGSRKDWRAEDWRAEVIRLREETKALQREIRVLSGSSEALLEVVRSRAEEILARDRQLDLEVRAKAAKEESCRSLELKVQELDRELWESRDRYKELLDCHAELLAHPYVVTVGPSPLSGSMGGEAEETGRGEPSGSGAETAEGLSDPADPADTAVLARSDRPVRRRPEVAWVDLGQREVCLRLSVEDWEALESNRSLPYQLPRQVMSAIRDRLRAPKTFGEAVGPNQGFQEILRLRGEPKAP